MDTILISSTLITILLLLIGFSFFLVLRKKIRREEKSNKALVQSLISNLKEKEKRNEKQERELKNRENILIKEQLILTKELADISRERKKIESKKISLEAQQKNLEKKQQEIARITEEEAKEIIIQRVKKTLKNYTTNSIIQQQNDLKEKRKKLTVNVICSAIEKIAKDIVNAEEQDETINLSFEKKITIEGDVNKQKGRLIGREGRNIKALQEISGTEINFSGPAGEIINISSFNPLRRLLAYETILRLLSYHVVHPKKVEDT